MIISRVIQAEKLSKENLKEKVLLPSASNEKGHSLQGTQIGELYFFKRMNDGRIRLTLVGIDDAKTLIHAFVKPEWAVIFPIDGAGHTW